MGEEVLFTPVNEGKFPVPLAAKPIVVFVFVQANDEPVGVVEKLIALTVPPHCAMFATAVITGFGFTVIVNVIGVPAQPFAVGVTVIVAVIVAPVLFTAVKAGKFPVPFAAKPILVAVLVHAYVVPVIDELNVVIGTLEFAQYVWFETGFITGEAFTTTLCVITFVHPVFDVATNETIYVPAVA